jgi:hypothetical protein
MMPGSTKALDVKYTNISKKVDYGNFCSIFGEMYHLAVVYNGVPEKEPEDVTKDRIAAQARRCQIAEGPTITLQPGESNEILLYYEATKPGRYEFTVDVDTDPLNPSKNTKVRSNTVTLIERYGITALRAPIGRQEPPCVAVVVSRSEVVVS